MKAISLRMGAAALLLVLFFNQAGAAAESSRSEFLKLLARERPLLEGSMREIGRTNELRYVRFEYTSEPGQRVPGLVVKLAEHSGRLPVIIAAHGTGGKKEGMLSLLQKYARAGFLAVAIDGRYAGERTKLPGTTEYNQAILRAFQTGEGHPFYYDTAWDLMRLVDWIEAWPDAEAKRIGLIGISKGGIETYLAAAADPRISVAIPCIGVQSFRWALENDAWRPRVDTIKTAFEGSAKKSGFEKPDAAFVRTFYDKVVPGIYDRFDGPAMLPLIAPRPLMVINGDSDDKTPVPGIEAAAKATHEAYARAGASDRFVLTIQPRTGHNVTDASHQAALEWFVKWLKN